MLLVPTIFFLFDLFWKVKFFIAAFRLLNFSECLLDLNNYKRFSFCLWMWRFPAMHCIVLSNVWTVGTLKFQNNIFHFLLYTRFFRQVCLQSHLARSLLLNAAFSTWHFSNVLAQTLLLSKYHSNKTNCYHWRNQHRVRAINTEYTGALQEISITQNQSFPCTKLLHDQRAINKTTSINQTKPIVSLDETAPRSARNQ